MKEKYTIPRIMKSATRTGSLLVFFIAIVLVVAGTRMQGAGAQGKSDSHHDEDWDDNGNDHQPESYVIGLWGDLPYSDVQANTGVPNLIADMNSQDLAFTVHDGDLKAGKGTPSSITPTDCSNAKYVQAMTYFQMLHAPAAFTPGDNDWVDCDAASNGPFNSLERLDHERTLFFSTAFTFGQHRLHQAVQTDANPCKGWVAGDFHGTTTYKTEACVENRRWTYRGVTYATLNIQGSCDNRCKDFPDPAEADARRDADIAWMRETFKVAKDRNSIAVMLISQADPGFNEHPIESENIRDAKTLICSPVTCSAATPDGFFDFLKALRDEVVAFRKPVAYVHGDTHYFRIDKPFLDSTGRRLENFTRIETFGDNVFSVDALHPDQNDLNNVHWVKAFVDPHSREVFSYQPQIVPGNRVAVPVP